MMKISQREINHFKLEVEHATVIHQCKRTLQ